MTDPTTDTSEAEQRRIRDMLVRDACFATDMFLDDNAQMLTRVTKASATRLTLQVAIGYLIGQGLIRATPENERPEWLAMDVPEHLQPDLAEAVAELDRLNAWARGER